MASFVGLLLLSPLFMVMAILIKLDDGGPVFYIQRRVGAGFRTFSLLKFRTMTQNADRAGLLTTQADARITRTGRWLRKTKADELPQLWNVLKGEMRLVGARPEVEKYVRMFEGDYREILQDPPGITDPASIAFRDEQELLQGPDPEQIYITRLLPQKLRLSRHYASRRSLLRDLLLVCRTVTREKSPSGRDRI